MTRVKQAHHRGTHQIRARRVVQTANANPSTICPRCGLTRIEGIQQWGQQGEWEAGHTIDGQVNGQLRAEHRHCNRAAGGQLRHQRNEPHSERW